jgi:beta-glucosidase
VSSPTTDAAGEPLLREAFGTDEADRARGILGDEELIRVIGNFPLSRLAAFPGIGLDHATLSSVLAKLGSARV